MIYKDFQNLRLPMLGFGSMRLPLLPGGGDGDVDEAAVAEMVALAMERGANYFDTAYGYHNGIGDTGRMELQQSFLMAVARE